MDNILKYLNENPGIGIIIAAIAVLVTVIGWLIKKRQKSAYKNSPHITAGGDISSGGNIVVGNSNVVEATKIINGRNPVLKVIKASIPTPCLS